MTKRIILLVEITSPPPPFGALSIANALTQPPFGATTTQTLLAIGGSGALVWQLLGNVPPGISIDRNTGEVFGLWSVPGSYRFYARVADAVGQFATRAFFWAVPDNATPEPPAAGGLPIIIENNIWLNSDPGAYGTSASGTSCLDAIAELQTYIGETVVDFSPLTSVAPGGLLRDPGNPTFPNSYFFFASQLPGNELRTGMDVDPAQPWQDASLTVTEAYAVEIDACGGPLAGVIGTQIDETLFYVASVGEGSFEAAFIGSESDLGGGLIGTFLLRVVGTVTTAEATYNVDFLLDNPWNSCI